MTFAQIGMGDPYCNQEKRRDVERALHVRANRDAMVVQLGTQLRRPRQLRSPALNTLAIAVMVFQLRVVTGTPKSRSNVPR